MWAVQLKYISIFKVYLYHLKLRWRHDMEMHDAWHGPLTRCTNLRVAHAPRMPGAFFPPTRVSDPNMHYGMCVTHVPWCMPGSLTSGFLWSRWRGERSRHSWRMRNPQIYVSGKRPIEMLSAWLTLCDGNQPFGCIFPLKKSHWCGSLISHLFFSLKKPLNESLS